MRHMQFSNQKLKNDEEQLSGERIILQEIGSVLKGTREKKSLTLDEVKEITCIPVHHILAIENGVRENLPEDFYLIGFLKRYAKALGLNERSITNMYSRRTMFINTELRKDENNNDFDLLFDNGGDRNNLFKRERKKLNNMDKEKSFFSIFHFYLLIGAVLFVSAIYLVFNLIVNNPFDPKNKTFKEVIVENEHEEELEDEKFAYQDEEASQESASIDDSKIASNDPSSDVVLEFKKVKGSNPTEDEEYEEIAVNDEIENNEAPESKIVIKSFLPQKESVQQLISKPISNIEKIVAKPKSQEQEKITKQVQPVVQKIAIKPVIEEPVKTIQIKKQPKPVVVAKPVQQQVKIAKTVQLKTQPKAIKQVASKPLQKIPANKPTQIKSQQTKLASNNQKTQKFCVIKKSVVKPQVTKLVQSPKIKSVQPQKVVVQNIQKPAIVETKKTVEVQKIAKASPSKAEMALKATQLPVVKPQPQESTASDEIMLRPLRIVE